MKKILLAFAVLLLTSAVSFASPIIGEPAPDFTGTDSNGNAVKLSDYAGYIVVLEWTNDGCPFVHKHYDSGNMQALQKKAAAEDVVWLSIISSAPGKQGNVTGAQANELTKTRDAAPAAVILDPTGEIGHLYEAKTTPHMFVIDANGVLAYAGAIDDKPSVDQADIAVAINYVQAAIDSLKEGKPVETPTTKSYGCSVKY